MAQPEVAPLSSVKTTVAVPQLSLAVKVTAAGILSHDTAASAADKDDLKVISGVGPFIEEKLNGLGIYTYEQVSQFDADVVKVVTAAIQFFPGRIERDEWAKQALELFQAKSK